ncbi:tryptophan synthase subunit beta like protein [Seongchinamella unica]|uniref:Tryptophan synthase subunit beta like protein n=1 Tax=Seongchinamella unica TaxID=2547392 RepID=A0A4R5LV51_9GAMM|nr:tryptophan synthase subunit beta like protein [Seongchinamella unica]TDG15251.1 tryptophan synthase subunit beta like protein [Seongchinamella unica]
MPYIKRDEQGRVIAMSAVSGDGFTEQVAGDSPELADFLASQQAANSLDATDQDFVRVLEDVVELLIDKGVILFTELPDSAQEKIMRRQKLRSEMTGKLDLIGDD